MAARLQKGRHGPGQLPGMNSEPRAIGERDGGDPYLVPSTDGPLASARIRCPRGHCFNGPLQSLTRDNNQAQPAWAQRGA
jgi:hypothetical protein